MATRYKSHGQMLFLLAGRLLLLHTNVIHHIDDSQTALDPGQAQSLVTTEFDAHCQTELTKRNRRMGKE